MLVAVGWRLSLIGGSELDFQPSDGSFPTAPLGGGAFETRLCSLFVNPSLIIFTELENKSVGNDAEPEITPEF